MSVKEHLLFVNHDTKLAEHLLHITGLDTLKQRRPHTLSGGQKQRVAIARALLQAPPILIFDDSLSAVDTETDLKIRNALKRRKGKATTFIIAHRITTVSEADIIIVLEDGRITQMGTHEELKEQQGLYRRICLIQNRLDEDISSLYENYQNAEVDEVEFVAI